MEVVVHGKWSNACRGDVEHMKRKILLLFLLRVHCITSSSSLSTSGTEDHDHVVVLPWYYHHHHHHHIWYLPKFCYVNDDDSDGASDDNDFNWTKRKEKNEHILFKQYIKQQQP